MKLLLTFFNCFALYLKFASYNGAYVSRNLAPGWTQIPGCSYAYAPSSSIAPNLSLTAARSDSSLMRSIAAGTRVKSPQSRMMR